MIDVSSQYGSGYTCDGKYHYTSTQVCTFCLGSRILFISCVRHALVAQSRAQLDWVGVFSGAYRWPKQTGKKGSHGEAKIGT